MIAFIVSSIVCIFLITHLHLTKVTKIKHRFEDPLLYVAAIPLLSFLLIGLSKSPELIPIFMIPVYFMMPKFNLKSWIQKKLREILEET